MFDANNIYAKEFMCVISSFNACSLAPKLFQRYDVNKSETSYAIKLEYSQEYVRQKIGRKIKI